MHKNAYKIKIVGWGLYLGVKNGKTIQVCLQRYHSLLYGQGTVEYSHDTKIESLERFYFQLLVHARHKV